MNKEKFFVTTPIYYINDVPHIGHAYATIASDILNRYHEVLGEKTFLLTGSDENSQKTVASAKKSGLSTEEYSDKMSAAWKEAWRKLGIADGKFHFVRTTNPSHAKFVQEFFQQLYDKGFVKEGIYQGLYCVGHEAFLRETDLDEKKLCPDHKTKPEILKEKNYFFLLKDKGFEKILLDYFEKHPDFIQPEERKHEIVNFIKSGLENVSISRENAKWGISVPFDKDQKIYVWFDALLSYYSTTPKEFWPADVHIVGKDILRFHAVIWPAMLLALDYPLPKKIFAHGFFTIDGTKISKSLGNTIDPLKISEKYGADALRYFLFKEIPFGNDGDFSFERLTEVYNSDLANGLGNLIARVAKLAESLNLNGFEETKKPLLDSTVRIYLDKLEFLQALEYIWKKIRTADKKLEETKPWELIKTDPSEATEIIENLVRQIIEIQELLIPFLPETAEKIKKQFSENSIKSSEPLFPRK